jgi:hypothetical protein
MNNVHAVFAHIPPACASCASSPERWKPAYDCALPGAHLIAIAPDAASYPRIALAVEAAGFAVRDCLLYLSDPTPARTAFLASLTPAQRTLYDALPVSSIPAPASLSLRPILLARKPLPGSVAQNVLTYRTAALNIDRCRIGTEERTYTGGGKSIQVYSDSRAGMKDGRGKDTEYTVNGRFPANVLHDGSAAVLSAFAEYGERGGQLGGQSQDKTDSRQRESGFALTRGGTVTGDAGTAARFFASLPPADLTAYLIRLITPPMGTILDAFPPAPYLCDAATAEGFTVQTSPETPGLTPKQ